MLYLQWDKWTLPLLLWERRQIGTTCLVALLPGLLTCTSHSRPHSDATPRARGHFYARWCRERLAEWQPAVYREALIWICRQRMMYGRNAIGNMNLKVKPSVLLVSEQPHRGSKWHRTGLLTKCCKKQEGGRGGGRENDQIVCLCTHCIPGYLYRVKKKTV